ncbi:hypothetical protein F4860DRAFT_520563 [Xylaria cubensis]|nr:hypothetical protein F4860DRAFT_520563 [Xylaria cubensis]
MTFWTPIELPAFSDMRTLLHLTLYMCPLVDTCGRGGKLAWNMKRPEHMHLKWEDVEFFAFQCAEDLSFAVSASPQVYAANIDGVDLASTVVEVVSNLVKPTGSAILNRPNDAGLPSSTATATRKLS